MKFHYIASEENGKITEADVNAPDVQGVLRVIAKQGLKPISVRPERSIRKMFQVLQANVSIADQIFISKYLSLMLKIGTGLMEAINILIQDFTKPAVNAILLEIRTSLEEGNPFYTTFARHPKVFSEVYINLIRAGEKSGNLQQTFENLTLTLTKQKELRDQIKNALTYPLLLLVGSCAILAFIIMFALPKVAGVFTDGGFAPPPFSQLVFQIGFFLKDYGVYFLVILIIGFIGLLFGYRSSLRVRKIVTNIFKGIPVVKEVVKKIALQRFASILSSLIKAGLPLTEGLEITAHTMGNPEGEIALNRIANEGIAKGLTVGEAFRRESFFPVTVVNLVAISEKAGHLSEVLETLSDFYAKEIDSAMKTLVAFLEPVLLLFIGVVIGVIALAIIIPIYQLTTQF